MEAEDQLKQLERRVSLLEEEVARLKSAAIRPAPPEPAGSGISPPFKPAGAYAEQVRTPSLPPVPSRKFDWEADFAKVWLPRIFIVVMLLGMVWAFIAAVDYGLVTEPVRLLLGLLVALLLGILAERQHRSKRNALAQVLYGGGLAASMLTIFAGNMLYELIPSSAAFILHVLVIGGGVFLTVRLSSQTLGILSGIGGVLVPFLVQSGDPSTAAFAVYETALSLTFLAVAVWRKHRALQIVMVGLYHTAMLLYAVLAGLPSSEELVYVAAITIHHGFFLILLLARLGRQSGQPILFASFALTAMWAHVCLEPSEFVWYMLGFAVLYAAASGYSYRTKDAAAFSLASSAASFALAYLVVVWFEAATMGMLLIVQGSVSVWLAIQLKHRWQAVMGASAYGLGSATILFHPFDKLISPEALAWAIWLASLTVIIALLNGGRGGTPPVAGRLGWVRGLKWFHLFVAVLILSQASMALTHPMSRDLTHMAMSLSWALYAIAAIVYGSLRNSRDVRIMGISLLMLTLLKLIFIDLPNVETWIRALLFLAVGAGGVAVSRLWYKKEEPY